MDEGRDVIGQEQLWRGKFGYGYRLRNSGESLVKSNVALFGKVLGSAENCGTVLELGAGSGMNVEAVRSVFPRSVYTAVEINKSACEDLGKIEGVEVVRQSILEYQAPGLFDLVFTKGVLIHMPPEELGKVYDLMFFSSRQYVALIEYHDQQIRPLRYRGRAGRLWKRDFCGELRARHPELKLVDYGFLYKGDELGQGEDLNWFLLEKAV